MTEPPFHLRDYILEMNTYVRTRLPEGDLGKNAIASRLVRELLRDDRDLLEGWLMENAEHFMAELVRKLFASERSVETRKRVAFADAMNTNDTEKLTHFAERYHIPSANVYRQVKDMTGADHIEVALSYRGQAKNLKLREAFHLAVGKMLGDRKTSEVMSPDEYDRLYVKMIG